MHSSRMHTVRPLTKVPVYMLGEVLSGGGGGECSCPEGNGPVQEGWWVLSRVGGSRPGRGVSRPGGRWLTSDHHPSPLWPCDLSYDAFDIKPTQPRGGPPPGQDHHPTDRTTLLWTTSLPHPPPDRTHHPPPPDRTSSPRRSWTDRCLWNDNTRIVKVRLHQRSMIDS